MLSHVVEVFKFLANVHVVGMKIVAACLLRQGYFRTRNIPAQLLYTEVIPLNYDVIGFASNSAH